MEVVVVLHGPIILIVYLDHELQKLSLINFLVESIDLDNSRCHDWHLHLATDNA